MNEKSNGDKMKTGSTRGDDYDDKVAKRVDKEVEGKRQQGGQVQWNKLGDTHKSE